jgi:transcriptional regulator with XRE-family HTH domain
MGSRQRAIDIGTARGRASVADLLSELREARVDRGLSGAALARAVGLSPSQYSRIERGRSGDLSIQLASRMLAAVGLVLHVRAFPAGEPLRDAAHAKLLERLRRRMHRSLRFMTEVPLPAPNDRRAWDAVISGPTWRVGVEAETRPRDRQALERRLQLKLRDGGVDHVLLLLMESRHNRDFVRAHGPAMADQFPVGSRRCLELLGAGVDPGGSALICL